MTSDAANLAGRRTDPSELWLLKHFTSVRLAAAVQHLMARTAR